MSDKPPFDPVRFACYLIAGVLGVQATAILIGFTMCVVHAELIIASPDIVCDPKDRLTTLMQGMLAAALALLAGFTGKGPPGSNQGGKDDKHDD
jgi:hypothetical protein